MDYMDQVQRVRAQFARGIITESELDTKLTMLAVESAPARAAKAMDEMVRAAWTIVTRADALFDDSGVSSGTPDVALLDLLPANLRDAYMALRFGLLDLSELDGWAGSIMPLSDVDW